MFTDGVEDFVGRLGPDERVLAAIPAGGEGPNAAGQVTDRGEGAAQDGLALYRSRTRPRRGFGHERDVGVKWTWMRGVAASQPRTSAFLWVA